MPEPVDIDGLKADDVVIKGAPVKPAETPAADDKKPIEGEEKKPVEGEGEEKKPVEGEGEEKKPVEGEGEGEGESELPVEAEVDWGALSEETGVEVDSEEAIVESLKELATYRALSPALQKAIEIEKNNGDVAAYFKVLGYDPKTLSERDALWEQYVADNPKRFSGNPKFAQLDFERKMSKEYSVLIEYESLPANEKEDFFSEHEAEIEYLQEKRKFDAEAARASLQEARDKIKFYETKPEKEAVDVEAIAAAHAAGYKKALEEFDVVTLGMGKDVQFNVGVSDTNKKYVNEWMKNPDKFLNEIGFYNGKVDYDTLMGWVTLIADIKYGNFGERLRQSIIDNTDIATLEKTLDAPGVIKKAVPDPTVEGDDWDKVANAFVAKRNESMKRR